MINKNSKMGRNGRRGGKARGRRADQESGLGEEGKDWRDPAPAAHQM